MKLKIHPLVATCAASLTLCLSAQAATLVKAYEFNTAGDVEGWAGTPSTSITGLTQASSTSLIPGTTEGVLTAGDIVGGDPQLTRGTITGATGGAGTTISDVQFRFRQLTLNPNESGVAFKSTLDFGSTIILVNGTNLGVPGGLAAGTGSAFGGTYTRTITNPDSEGWAIFNVAFTGPITLTNVTSLRIDPLGGTAVGQLASNFELDYVRVFSVPEPSSAALSIILGGICLLRRRR